MGEALHETPVCRRRPKRGGEMRGAQAQAVYQQKRLGKMAAIRQRPDREMAGSPCLFLVGFCRPWLGLGTANQRVFSLFHCIPSGMSCTHGLFIQGDTKQCSTSHADW